VIDRACLCALTSAGRAWRVSSTRCGAQEASKEEALRVAKMLFLGQWRSVCEIDADPVRAVLIRPKTESVESVDNKEKINCQCLPTVALSA
jgi:hypothetical protein